MTRSLLIVLASGAVMTACTLGALGGAPSTPAEAPPVLTPLPPTATTAALTPAVTFSELTAIPGAGIEPSRVVGLARNDSSLPLVAATVAIEVRDASGAKRDTLDAPLLLTILQPGATSPFIASLPAGAPPASLEARLDSYEFGPRSAAEIAAAPVGIAASGRGRFALGLVHNTGSHSATLEDLAIIWRDASGALAGAVRADFPTAAIPPGEAFPWSAALGAAGEPSEIEAFVSALGVHTPDEAGLESVADPQWHLTAQGRGFVTGEVRNHGRGSFLPEVAVALWSQGELVGFEILRSPVPLPAGETLAYGAEAFPDLEQRLDRLGVGAETIVPTVILSGQAVPASAGPLLLAATVQQFEVIGSRVFLQGRVTHPGIEVLAEAGIYVTLTSTYGELQSARWLTLAPPTSGGEMEFRIDLPLPAGSAPSLSEVDLRALAMAFTP